MHFSSGREDFDRIPRKILPGLRTKRVIDRLSLLNC